MCSSKFTNLRYWTIDSDGLGVLPAPTGSVSSYNPNVYDPGSVSLASMANGRIDFPISLIVASKQWMYDQCQI